MKKEKNEKGLNIAIILLLIITLVLAALLVLAVTGKLDLNKVIDVNNNNKTEEKKDNNKIYSADEYITLEDVSFTSKASTKKVKFKHLDENVTSQFYKDQQVVIDNIHVSDSEVFNAEYKLKYAINNNILSVLYMIEESNEIGKCATMAAVTNIDLVNNKVVSEEELLSKAGTSYKKLVEDYYATEKDRWKKYNEQLGHDMDYYEVTYEDFSTNQEKYINIGLEKLPSKIYTYIEDGKIKYDYYSIHIGTLFHQVGKGGCFNWETVTLGDYK